MQCFLRCTNKNVVRRCPKSRENEIRLLLVWARFSGVGLLHYALRVQHRASSTVPGSRMGFSLMDAIASTTFLVHHLLGWSSGPCRRCQSTLSSAATWWKKRNLARTNENMRRHKELRLGLEWPGAPDSYFHGWTVQVPASKNVGRHACGRL